jgi:hypothetical protein
MGGGDWFEIVRRWIVMCFECVKAVFGSLDTDYYLGISQRFPRIETAQ